MPGMWLRLAPLTLAEWRHHPWRHAVALLAVALGVALAVSVQMINASALSEFAQAVRSANGEPDTVLAASTREGFSDAAFAPLARHPEVLVASPVLELEDPGPPRPGTRGQGPAPGRRGRAGGGRARTRPAAAASRSGVRIRCRSRWP